MFLIKYLYNAVFLCLPGVRPCSALLHLFWMAGTFGSVEVHPAGHLKDTLEFQELRWFNSKTDFSVKDYKKMLSIFKGTQHSCRRAQHKCVEQLASPPAFSRTDVCHSVKNKPCCPSATCCFSLHCGSTLNQSIGTVHFHRFLLRPIGTLYILYLKPFGNMYVSI